MLFLYLQLKPDSDLQAEYFAVYLPNAPVASVVGGAKLKQFFTTAKIEPFGVIRFASDSRTRDIIEPENKQLEVGHPNGVHVLN